MSRVVKGIGRAVKKVVGGIAKAVKRVVKSKFGKIVLGAAAIYFGGAALMGATGSSAAGLAAGGGWAGAGAGLSSAASGLGTALTGGGLGGMGEALGMGGAAEAAAPTLLGEAGGYGAASGGSTISAASPWAVDPTTGLNTLASETTGAAQGGGIVNRALSAANSFVKEHKLGAPLAILAGNVGSSYVQQSARLQELADKRQAIIDGHRSGYGLGPWG